MTAPNDRARGGALACVTWRGPYPIGLRGQEARARRRPSLLAARRPGHPTLNGRCPAAAADARALPGVALRLPAASNHPSHRDGNYLLASTGRATYRKLVMTA